MGLDARLASVELLTLAAMAAKRRQTDAPRTTITLRVVYAAGFDPAAEPEYEGPSYVYELPEPGERP